MKLITRRWRYFFKVFIVLGLLGATNLSTAQAQSNCDPDGAQDSGAIYRICMPDEGQWNGDLVVYAHGYVAFNEPIAIPEDQLNIPGGPSVPEIVNGLGFGFVTTSYSTNGLAVRQGLADVVDVVSVFEAQYGSPNRVYLLGPSEGGIITALGIEQHADVFDGGLSACGPVGDFQAQINYWGDLRVLFDYFFPDALPGSPISIPEAVIDNWETVYEPQIETLLRHSPVKREELLATAKVPAHPTDVDENIDALLDLLWYNVFATNDGIMKLAGQPFDNQARLYHGSLNDLRLNQRVARFMAEASAIGEIDAYYQTQGNLNIPLVLMHTIDPVVPYWHEPLYRAKVFVMNKQNYHTHIPVRGRYGHCRFTTAQLLFGFAVLVYQATGESIPNAERVLWTEEQRLEYRALVTDYAWSP